MPRRVCCCISGLMCEQNQKDGRKGEATPQIVAMATTLPWGKRGALWVVVAGGCNSTILPLYRFALIGMHIFASLCIHTRTKRFSPSSQLFVPSRYLHTDSHWVIWQANYSCANMYAPRSCTHLGSHRTISQRRRVWPSFTVMHSWVLSPLSSSVF